MSYPHYDSYTFPVELFNVGTTWPDASPYACPDHSYCFRADYDAIRSLPAFRSAGTWKLVNPVNLGAYPMPLKQILTLKIHGWQEWGMFYNGAAEGDISIVVDGTKVFHSAIQRGGKDFPGVLNSFVFNPPIDVTNAKTLDLQLWQTCFANIAWINVHDSSLFLSMVGYDDTPSPTAALQFTVTNKQTGAPLANAHVVVLAGNRVVADGRTDLTGSVSFSNVDEGSYEVVITASGYHELGQSMAVKAPSTWYRLSLTPMPPIDWMAWLMENWYVPVGVGAGVLVLLLLWPKSPITIISPQREV